MSFLKIFPQMMITMGIEMKTVVQEGVVNQVTLCSKLIILVFLFYFLYCVTTFVDLIKICYVVPGTCSVDTAGQEFVLMFMENNSPDRDAELYITTSNPNGTFVTVTSPGWTNPSIDERINVTSQRQSKVVINRNLITVGTGISRKAIKISSSAEISVTAFHRQGSNCDGFVVYPINALGTAYMAVSVSLNAQIGIVSPEDSITVELTFPSITSVSINIEGTQYGPGSTFRTVLNQYQTLQIQDNSGSDLTGTLVRSNRPIAMFSGNSYTYIGNTAFVDHLVEQLPPVSTWGTDFIVVPTPNTDTGGNIKVVASQANTNVQIFRSTVVQRILFSAGDSFAVQFTNAEFTWITATKPVLVVQLSRSGGSVPSEPAMTVIPPKSQYLTSYTASVPPLETGLFQNHIFLISTFNQVPGIIYDGTPVGSGKWVAVASATDGTAVRRLSVTPGLHTITNNAPLGVYQYGYVDTGCSYLYPTGQCLDAINSVVSYRFPTFPKFVKQACHLKTI